MSNIKFTGIMPAIVTPFDENQKLKEKAVREMMNWHFDNGSAGFYICGAMGEGLPLPKETRMNMAETAVENAKRQGRNNRPHRRSQHERYAGACAARNESRGRRAFIASSVTLLCI